MSSKTPMELLKEVAPEFAQNQLEEKALLFDHERYMKQATVNDTVRNALDGLLHP